ncbi:MAG: hypothetical protein PHN55_00895 [Dysgonamonadaceae bacterium]|nr:hypothetical protein [Dysgonamonadaceae bacterium]
MRKIYLLGFLIGLIAFVGCSEDDLVTPTPSPEAPAGTQGVYFPTSNKSAVELMPVDPTEFEMTIARTVSSGAVDVPINVEVNDDDVFVVPSSVSFAEGETEKTFKITFPTAAEGITYNLKLNVEGEEFVNPYITGLSYVSTNATRVKWEAVEEPMVYMDGSFSAGWGISHIPMYVHAEKAVLGSVVRYRFKNAYKVPTGADDDGIYDGFPFNDPGDFIEGEYLTIVEIGGENGKADEVFMPAHDIGVDWGYGMISTGSVFGNLSEKKEDFPLGILKDSIITFPENSLFHGDNDGKYPAPLPTIIYLSKNVYIAANLKIESFNDIEYEDDAVETGTFISAATSDTTLLQIMVKAIDIDEENKDSEYKDLFYLPNLYEEDFGLAFYYSEEAGISIPKDQPTGMSFLGKKVFVSMSRDIKSGLIIGSEEVYDEDLDEDDDDYDPNAGKDRYVFGLNFHYKDGTNLGNFKEVLLLSNEDEITPMMLGRKGVDYRFEIQSKVSPKSLTKNVQRDILF